MAITFKKQVLRLAALAQDDNIFCTRKTTEFLVALNYNG
jgi:hypothetical protein